MLKGWSRHLLVHGHAHLMKVTSRVCRSRRRAVYQSAITPTPIGPHYPPSTTTIIPRPITLPTTTTTGDSHKQNVRIILLKKSMSVSYTYTYVHAHIYSTGHSLSKNNSYEEVSFSLSLLFNLNYIGDIR